MKDKPMRLKLLTCCLLVLCLTISLKAQTQSATNQFTSDNIPKKAWAHLCGWGFNVEKTYDQPNRFSA
ncbi:MAG: hypothetical protein ACF8OB_11030, partial [Phycisphaeraceae bacterium JB051]